MASSRARAVPWHALVRFHREVSRRAEQAFFALPVTASATERWSSLAGFAPGQLTGPWVVALDVLESDQLKRSVRTGLGEAFIGGPCWYRWKSAGGQERRLEWIPLMYRGVKVEERDDRLHIVPVQADWEVCPLVWQLLERHEVRIAAPLDEMLPELLSSAVSDAGEDGPDPTDMLIDAIRSAAPELGELLVQARDGLPADQLEVVPSPWVLFTAPDGTTAVSPHIRRDYDRLEHHLATAPHALGGLGLLEDVSGAVTRTSPPVVPIVPLDDIQRSAVETVLAGRPVTVIAGPPGSGKRRVTLSILLNAWASSTSVLYASRDPRALDAVRRRLQSIASDCEIAVGAGGERLGNIDDALERTLKLIKARQGETHYGGSPTARTRRQLVKKKQLLQELIDNGVPQRVSRAMRAALESHGAQGEALHRLESRREELARKLRSLGVVDEPESFDETVVGPLRKWRSGIEAARRLIEEDSQRATALKSELSAVRVERDSVLNGYQVDTQSDEEPSWLLVEPGFKSFEQAMAALSDKLRDPIEDDLGDAAWDGAYDAWSGAEEAAQWERMARETASLIRPAGIALKEKVEEVHAAREALDAAQRRVQEATKSSSLDVRRKDLDEWGECYAELCTLPRSKLAFRLRSRSAQLTQRLEMLEGQFRISFPPHLWSSIGTLDESGRARLSAVVEHAREWIRARDDWDRLSSVRHEIEAQTDALRDRLVALGLRSLSSKVTPTASASIAAELNAKASEAARAAVAWGKREARERLPGELMGLAARIRAAGAGTPIKERWMNGPGAPLMAALDALANEPGIASINAVRRELLGSAEPQSVLQIWRRAYEAQNRISEIIEQLERIPSRSARLTHWKSRRPASLPAELDVEGAFDGDGSHPVWAFLEACEEWSREWSAFRDEETPELEHTAESAGSAAIQRMREAAQALPPGKERTRLESLIVGPEKGEPWPVEEIIEKAALWRPQRLKAEIDKIDARLEGIEFDTAKEQWLDRVTLDAESLRSLDALRAHYERNRQRIEEDGYPHFERSLKLQPVWVTTPMSTQSIPLQPGLFELLVIDDPRTCTLTSMIPLLFRAKRLVVIGDPEQQPSTDSLGLEAQRTLASRFGVEGWAELFGHVGNDAYKAAIGNLPGRKVEVLSLVEGE